MDDVDLFRRRLIRGAGLAGAGLALSGCKLLDGASVEGNWMRRVMEISRDLTYHTHRLIIPDDALAPEYRPEDIRQPMVVNGSAKPTAKTYAALAEGGFRDWRLEVGGLVEQPLSLSLADLRSMPARTQITRHDCVEGWSCIAEWTGTPLKAVLDAARPTPAARFVHFKCYDTVELLFGPIEYYETIDFVDAYHPQTILAYGVNGEDLPTGNGAPLRVRVERQLGYKMAKFVYGIDLVESFDKIGGGKGSFWADLGYAWYAGI